MATLGLDVGTSRVKAVVWEPGRGVTAVGTGSYPLRTARDGTAEQDPEDWLAGLEAAVTALPAAVRDRIAAVGFTGQMHALLVTDGAGAPLAPAMLWMDERAGAEAALLRQREDAAWWRARLGRLPEATLPLAKWLWLRSRGGLALPAGLRVWQVKDWVRARLGGSFVTDPGEASGTDFWHLAAGRWAPEVAELAGLPPTALPAVQAATAPDGRLDPGWARRLGLKAGLPLVTGTGDLQAAASLYPLEEEGAVLVNLGTAGQVAQVTEGMPAPVPGVTVFAHASPGRRLALYPVLAVGLTLAWWQGILGDPWPQGGDDRDPGQLLVLPQLAGERGDGEGRLQRGAVFGLSAADDRASLTRGFVTGVVLSLKEAADALAEATGRAAVTGYLAGGGGLAGLLGPRLADALGWPLAVLAVPEPSAAGAAVLAAAAVGEEPGARTPVLAVQRVFEPHPALAGRYERLYALYRAARAAYAPLSGGTDRPGAERVPAS